MSIYNFTKLPYLSTKFLNAEMKRKFDNNISTFEIIVHNKKVNQTNIASNNDKWLDLYINKYYHFDPLNYYPLLQENILETVFVTNHITYNQSNHHIISKIRKKYNMDRGIVYMKQNEEYIMVCKIFIKNSYKISESHFIQQYFNNIRSITKEINHKVKFGN